MAGIADVRTRPSSDGGPETGAVEVTFRGGALHLAELVGSERAWFAIVRVASGFAIKALRALAVRGVAAVWLLGTIPI
jgi:hypothetical protein